MTTNRHRHLAVLGASTGIGLATARQAADHGFRVTMGARDADRLQAAAATVDSAKAIAVDAQDTQSITNFYRAAGPIDDLVVTVTRRDGGVPAERIAEQDLRTAFEGKTIAHLRALSLALNWLSDDASVTLVTGVTAQGSQPGTAVPAAVNGALESAIAPLARELAPRRVNAVSPGVIETDWWDSLGDARERALTGVAAGTPLGRNGRAEDVAAAILALAGNPHITGVVLPVDGGLRLV
jgi:NAD(P)-dependent dehydrogenase (short-subunit alcohol dehydrogenase family)